MTTIVLARPAAGNALNLATASALRDVLTELAAKPPGRAVVLRAEGGAFCVGGDVREIAVPADRASVIDELVTVIHEALVALRGLPTPVIDAVQGPVGGAEVGLVLSADIAVATVGATFTAAYAVAKAAVAAWTAGLSEQVGPSGFTANTIAPGYIADTDYFRGRLTDDCQARLIGATHNKRAGRPDDIAATLEFLASPGARHITGQTIHVNGGAHTTR